MALITDLRFTNEEIEAVRDATSMIYDGCLWYRLLRGVIQKLQAHQELYGKANT